MATNSAISRKPLTVFICVCVAVTFIAGFLGQSVYEMNVVRKDAIQIPNTSESGGVLQSLEHINNSFLNKMVNPQIDTNVMATATTPLTTTTAAVKKETSGKLQVAILIPSTSRSIPKEQFFQKSSLVTLTLPALQKTMETTKYDYTIYLGIDKGDYLETLQPQLKNLTKLLIPVVLDSIDITTCANGIAKRAYDDGMEYFVRINDDSIMVTEGWTTIGIEKLRSYKPPNVGVVGPTCKQGNTLIMTHDMVHRTHMDIFTHYYPVEFTNWWIDDWITIVYRPNRSTKLPNWEVIHKMIHGQRYAVAWMRQYRMKLVDTRDKPKLMAYIYPNRQVVSFCLFGTDARYTDGALANAELMKAVYPGWVMRIYYDATVPKQIIDQLGQFEFVHLIGMPQDSKHKKTWRYLVASDAEVNVYVIRDIDAHLSAREKSAVDKWLETDKKFHVMRDHPEQVKHAMCGGLWGGRKGAIPNICRMMTEVDWAPNEDESQYFLDFVIWPIVKESVLQHDSFSCKKYGPSSAFPTPRKEQEFVGSKYADGKVDQQFIDALKNAKECV